MKLSINADRLYKRFGAYEAGKMVKDAGFTAIDFSFTGMVKDDDPFLKDDYLEIAHKLRSDFDKAEIEINQAHAPFSFPHDWFRDEEKMKSVIMPRLIRSMEMAGILGAKAIIIHPIHYWCEECGEEAFKMNMDFYKSFIPYCEKFRIKVAVENMWMRDPRRGYIIHDTCSKKEEFVRYIDEIGSEYIIACLDVGHVGLPIQTDEAHDFIHALGNKRLLALHLHDNDYKGDSHMPPFFGKMNWYEIGKALGEIDYKGDFTYELSGNVMAVIPETLVPSLLKFYFDVLKYIADTAEKYRVVQ